MTKFSNLQGFLVTNSTAWFKCHGSEIKLVTLWSSDLLIDSGLFILSFFLYKYLPSPYRCTPIINQRKYSEIKKKMSASTPLLLWILERESHWIVFRKIWWVAFRVLKKKTVLFLKKQMVKKIPSNIFVIFLMFVQRRITLYMLGGRSVDKIAFEVCHRHGSKFHVFTVIRVVTHKPTIIFCCL